MCMTVIECPHCAEDLEMDDDAYGLFECPYCSGEYEWGEAPKKKTPKYNFKSRETINERTQKISSSNTSNRQRRLSNDSNLGYSALNFASLTIATILVFIIIIGLNSNSWYGFSYSEDDGEFEGNFGLSYVEYIVTEDERESYWDEDTTYPYLRGSIEGYESALGEAEASQKSVEEMCDDWEENERCDTMITQAQESVDYWNSWDTSGSFLFGLLLFILIILILILSCKLLIFLNHNGWLTSSDEMLRVFSKIEIISTLVTCSILSLGLIMYWLFVPNIENWWDIMDTSVPSGLSSGLGMIWWTTMLTSLALIATTTIESIAKKRA